MAPDESAECEEVDFVVLNPSFGLLLLEAKSGKQRRDGEAGEWCSQNAQKQEHEIHDPLEQ